MSRYTLWRTVLAAFLLAAAVPHLTQAAIDPAKVQKLLAEDGSSGDHFGDSVAMFGNTAVIGAPGDDDKGSNSGSAYVFVRAADGTWKQQAKLTAADGADKDYFGRGGSVAVSGDTAIIGAPGDDDKGEHSGSAYVFVRVADGTWTQQAKLTAADGAAGDYFSRDSSVAVSGDTAVIGALGDDDKGNDSGSAYVFIRAADGTWSQQAKLTAADGAAKDCFGRSVAMSDDTALIGAPIDDQHSGSAYVFVRAAHGTWKQQAKLTAGYGAAGDRFGNSVAVSGDTAVIGAPRDHGGGSAYMFVRAADGTWKQQAKLTVPDKDSPASFGRSVAVSGDTAVIGTFAFGEYGRRSAHVFVHAADGTWTRQDMLTAPDEAAWDSFGRSVAVSGDTVVVSAPQNSEMRGYGGSAYIYTIAGKQAGSAAQLLK